MKSWGHLNPKVIRKQVCTNLGAGVDVGLLRAAVSRQLRRISTDDVGDALFHIFPGSKKNTKTSLSGLPTISRRTWS